MKFFLRVNFGLICTFQIKIFNSFNGNLISNSNFKRQQALGYCCRYNKKGHPIQGSLCNNIIIAFKSLHTG